MTGGQIQILLAELNKIIRKLDLMDKNTVRWREDNADPSLYKKPKGEIENAGESAESHAQIDLMEVTETIEKIEESHSQNGQSDELKAELDEIERIAEEGIESHSINDREILERKF